MNEHARIGKLLEIVLLMWSMPRLYGKDERGKFVVRGYSEVVFIISGTGAAIWSKTEFGPTCHCHPEVVLFCSYAQFPALLPVLNASWKSCSMRVFSTTCDSASIIQLCQNGGLSVLS
jgi:hypothetical protein